VTQSHAPDRESSETEDTSDAGDASGAFQIRARCDNEPLSAQFKVLCNAATSYFGGVSVYAVGILIVCEDLEI
jgi:hypothetical protein